MQSKNKLDKYNFKFQLTIKESRKSEAISI